MVVAVPPMVSEFIAERYVDEAFTNLCNPVQLFALARFKSAVNVPPKETGDPPMDSVELVEFTVMEEFSSSVFPIV